MSEKEADPKRAQEIRDETERTLRRATFLLLGGCLYSVSVLLKPDVLLLDRNATFSLPFSSGQISYSAFLIAGPILLNAVWIYQGIFRRRLEDLGESPSQPLPHIYNLPGPASKIITGFLFYGMVPVTMLIYALKASPRPFVAHLLQIAFSISIGATVLQAHKRKRGKSINWFLTFGALLVSTALVFVLVDRPLDLRGANLKDFDLRWQNLSWAEGDRHTDFTGADLEGANLANAVMPGANLTGAFLSGADLTGANLSGTNLSEAIVTGADLKQSNLREATMRATKFASRTRMPALIPQTDLSGADLSKVDLSLADLSGLDLRKLNLSGAILSGAQLERVDLRDADLSWADLREANLRYARLGRADLSFADLREINLSSVFDLREANFSGNLLQLFPRINLSRAVLTRVNLSGAELRGFYLVDADLRWANLRDANLSGADLTGANLSGADLTGANLDGVAIGQSRPNVNGTLLVNVRGPTGLIAWAKAHGAITEK